MCSAGDSVPPNEPYGHEGGREPSAERPEPSAESRKPGAEGIRLLPRPCPLCVHVQRINRLARRHEESIALGASEADVTAHLGKPDPTDELALRRPHGDAAVTHVSTRVARHPEIAIHVAPNAVRSALDAIDHAIRKQPMVSEAVVAGDIERVQVTVATGTGIAGPSTRAGDIQ